MLRSHELWGSTKIYLPWWMGSLQWGEYLLQGYFTAISLSVFFERLIWWRKTSLQFVSINRYQFRTCSIKWTGTRQRMPAIKSALISPLSTRRKKINSLTVIRKHRTITRNTSLDLIKYEHEGENDWNSHFWFGFHRLINNQFRYFLWFLDTFINFSHKECSTCEALNSGNGPYHLVAQAMSCSTVPILPAHTGFTL